MNKLMNKFAAIAFLGSTVLLIQGFTCENPSKCGYKKKKNTHLEVKRSFQPEIIRNENSTDLTLAVAGMTCNGCGTKIEDALYQVEGIQGAVSSLENDNIVVTYDKTKVKIQQILQVISDTGYKGSLPKEGEV